MNNNQIISGIYHNLFNDVNSFEYQNHSKSVLLKKRNRARSTEELQESLINNVNYYQQMINGYYALTESMFNSKKYMTTDEFINKNQYLQAQAKSKVPSLVSKTLKEYKNKYISVNAVIEALEFDYTYKQAENEILLTVLGVLCNEGNITITKNLLSYEPYENNYQIRKYTEFYVNIFLDNIVPTGR